MPCILVMDEPTSALSREEVDRLFEIIQQLKRAGLTIIYISHHLSEVFRIADRVTVLRDGRKIATRDIAEVSPVDVVQMMVGKRIDEFYSKRKAVIGEPVLKVRNLTRRGFFHNVSFHACRGEILGIAGLSGAGRTELARSMCGLDPLDDGEVELGGDFVPPDSYQEAVRRGLFYLSEDRKTDGLFLRLPVQQNLVSVLIPWNTTLGIYSSRNDARVARDMIRQLEIVAASPLTDAGTLSGGNQQKVLLGKWLAARPKVLVLDEPTRGVDVGAKRKIHDAVMELADGGNTVILISSDLPELVGLSDRVVVMRNGHLIGEMRKEQLSEESVLLAANGHLENANG
jgi:ribose transport system ATP-binding protein